MKLHTTLASILPLTLSLTNACVIIGDGDSETAGDTASTSDSDSDSGDDELVPLDGPCGGAPASPSKIAVVTNDYVNGGLSIADAAMSVDVDVAATTTDTVATGHAGDLYLIHRYGFNAIDVLDSSSWATKGSFDVSVDGVAEPNPQSLVFASDGLGYLTLFGAPEIQVVDFQGAAPTKVGSIDISAFADDDGNPEAGVAIACGSTLLVGIQRLDPTYAPVDQSYLLAIDTASQSAIDLDPDAEGVQGLALEGAWPRQIRADPSDPSGETILVLTSGIERIHVPTASRSWAVSAESLEAVGITGFDTQAFVTDDAGENAYLSATDGTYPASAIYRLNLQDDTAAPEKLLSGVSTLDRAIERMGDQLWVGDATSEATGLRVWDLSVDPPTEMTAAPLDTGLPPHSLVSF